MQIMEDLNSKLSNKLQRGDNYIFGAGCLGKAIYDVLCKNSINVEGFIDNKSKCSYFNNIPIIPINKIPDKNANIIIASINYMYILQKQALDNGFKNILSYGELTQIFKELQLFNQAYKGLCEDYLLNSEKYYELCDLLEDEYSRKVLDSIIHYRKTLDSSAYVQVYEENAVQYFEDFIPNTEVFVDGGAYDGKNTLDYISRFPNYKKVYLFEPDTKSMDTTKSNLVSFNNIEYFECGISDNSKVLRFDSKHSLGSLISESGSTEIQCVSLDDIIKEDRAYIKLDIEGAELDAINGAKRLIQNGSPLAVCVYHKPEDIWTISARIKELYPQYKFKLRHYSTSIFETVLYAIP